jgi:enamine deaminase RidA (YjgF/YER057c/UK114 family)
MIGVNLHPSVIAVLSTQSSSLFLEERCMAERQNISSGSPYEPVAGYSRAVKVGNTIHVAGTTGLGPDGKVIAINDPYAQAAQALKIIERALQQLGASLQNVVRTRIYVTNMQYADAVIQAHGEVFKEIRPASTLVAVTRLIEPTMLVEIEADAIIG